MFERLVPAVTDAAMHLEILARRDLLIEGLAALLPADCLVTSEDERRAFETDAFTAYRRMPLAVAMRAAARRAACSHPTIWDALIASLACGPS